LRREGGRAKQRLGESTERDKHPAISPHPESHKKFQPIPSPFVSFKKIITMDAKNKELVNEISQLLLGGSAHADLKKALKDLPTKLRGVKPDNLPYSIWQLVEHIRIAQWDMLNFCLDPHHKSPKWPDEYWPKETGPKNDEAWHESIAQINDHLDKFIELLEHSNIYEKIPGGSGQTILKEALQLADHTAYHVAEIIVIRRLLGAWD